MTKARIQPATLSAARARVGLTVDVVAERMDVAVQRLKDWESGAEQPTFNQARELANIVRLPFAALFAPPTPRSTILPDLRTQGGRSSPVSVDLYEVYQDALFKQHWVADVRRDEGFEPLAFVGAGQSSNDVARAAAAITSLLQIVAPEQRRGASEAFLGVLVKAAELAGVLVLRSSTVGSNTRRALDVQEFRGFAIADVYAPLVFINTADAKAAQLFTFVHELTHLWRAETGVSQNELTSSSTYGDIERFCDAVAAEVLVPMADVVAVWQSTRSLEENLPALKRRYKVSALVVARRARDAGLITHENHAAWAAVEMQKLSAKKKSDGGPTQDVLVPLRNSPTVTEMVVRGVRAGQLLYRDAATLLGIQPAFIDVLAAAGSS
jgi:Zn-dependent peptidase ImmA (M78 family)/DNA-binding XRE family transcriptional regulator